MAENQARDIVLDYVSPIISGGHPIRLRDDLTREELFGWVFFFTAIRSEEDPTEILLAGNAPIIVDRSDGSIHPTGTALPIEHYIEEYKKSRG